MAEITEQAAKITGPLSGVATTWALDLGLRLGLFDFLSRQREGATADEVANELRLDPQYTHVVLRAAYAGEVLEREDGRYRLAEHMDTLLLDRDAPGYLAGAVRTFVALRETFLDLRDYSRTGKREWWNDFAPEWIDAVGENGQTYYRRMINAVIPKLPQAQERLETGARYLDLACGVCRGPAKVLAAYPRTTVTAVDCDAYTLRVAAEEMVERGLRDRFTFVESYLEDLTVDQPHDLAIINISLHEARDIERCVARVHDALGDGGVFLVSEFPFPANESDTRSIPGRLMCGVQAFEAHIGCQLLPTSSFVGLLQGAGFRDVGAINVTPMHVVIHGTR